MQPKKILPYIYCIFTSADQERILPVVQEMRQQGFRVECSSPGTGGMDTENIRNAGACMAVLSAKAFDDHQFRMELNQAVLLEKSSVLIYLENILMTPAQAMQLDKLPYLSVDESTQPEQISSQVQKVISLEHCRGKASASQAGDFSDEPTSVLAGVRINLYRERNGKMYPVKGRIFCIGKSPDKCDLVISDNSSISRRHAEIYQYDRKCFIRDLHSTNGTYVNQRYLQPDTSLELHHNDLVQLSDERFRVMIEWAMPPVRADT